jgi:hypothetical protein
LSKKPVIVAFALGLLLAIVVGVIGRVPTLLLIMRALVSAFAVALLYIVACIVVRRYLPELFNVVDIAPVQGNEVSADKVKTSEIGSNLDIVLPGDVEAIVINNDEKRDSNEKILKSNASTTTALPVDNKKRQGKEREEFFRQTPVEDLAKVMRTSMSKDDD